MTPTMETEYGQVLDIDVEPDAANEILEEVRFREQPIARIRCRFLTKVVGRKSEVVSLMRRMQKQLEELEAKYSNINHRHVSDKQAEQELIKLLKDLKHKNTHKTNAIELSLELRLPIDQVDKIIDKLEERKLLSEEK